LKLKSNKLKTLPDLGAVEKEKKGSYPGVRRRTYKSSYLRHLIKQLSSITLNVMQVSAKNMELIHNGVYTDKLKSNGHTSPKPGH